MAENIKFSTGKELDANCGFVGINEKFELSEGYDGPISRYDVDSQWDDDLTPDYAYTLSVPEQIELCDIMIARWQAFRKLQAANLPSEGTGPTQEGKV